MKALLEQILNEDSLKQMADPTFAAVPGKEVKKGDPAWEKKTKLSPDELVALADQMIAAQDPEEADRLEAKILAGFYGK